jgi:hypothetical protein
MNALNVLLEKVEAYRKMRDLRAQMQDILATAEHTRRRCPEEPPPVSAEEEAGWRRYLAAVDEQVALMEDMLPGRRPFGLLPELPEPPARPGR